MGGGGPPGREWPGRAEERGVRRVVRGELLRVFRSGGRALPRCHRGLPAAGGSVGPAPGAPGAHPCVLFRHGNMNRVQRSGDPNSLPDPVIQVNKCRGRILASL